MRPTGLSADDGRIALTGGKVQASLHRRERICQEKRIQTKVRRPSWQLIFKTMSLFYQTGPISFSCLRKNVGSDFDTVTKNVLFSSKLD